MKNQELKAEYRSENGKGVARTLRREGNVPAVLYGKGKATSITLQLSHVQKAFHTHAGSHAIFKIEISGLKDGSGQRLALVRDVQKDPITGKILHLDFFELSEKDLVRNRVPVEVVGNIPTAVKQGGVMEHNVRELMVEALPADMPDHIKIDVSHLELNQSYHVRDIPPIPGVKLLESPETVLIHIMPPRAEAPPVAEATEATAAAPEAPAEPGKK